MKLSPHSCSQGRLSLAYSQGAKKSLKGSPTTVPLIDELGWRCHIHCNLLPFNQSQTLSQSFSQMIVAPEVTLHALWAISYLTRLKINLKKGVRFGMDKIGFRVRTEWGARVAKEPMGHPGSQQWDWRHWMAWPLGPAWAKQAGNSKSAGEEGPC